MSVKKTLLTSLIILSLTSNAYTEDALILSKGQPAPYEGVLLPVEKLQQLRKDSLSLSDSQFIANSQAHQIELYKANEALYEKKVQTLTDQNSKLYEGLQSSRELSTWEKAGLIGLGFFTAGILSYGIYRAALGK